MSETAGGDYTLLQGSGNRRPLQCTVSVSRKFNLGNYESAEVFFSLQGITQDTTEDEIDALLDGPVQAGFMAIKQRIRARADAAKRGEDG